jgi:hypothetical protein
VNTAPLKAPVLVRMLAKWAFEVLAIAGYLVSSDLTNYLDSKHEY